MQSLYIIKVGGNVIDNEEALKSFLQDLASVDAPKILVHGGGKLATKMAEALNIPQQMVDGRRITDAETLKLVTMVYAGYINKNIVALLQSMGTDAIGISGADGNAIRAHKRQHASTDYGFAGDIDEVNREFLVSLLSMGKTIVMAPITHDNKGQLLNTNADTIAATVAVACSGRYETTLCYMFEKNGVLKDADDEESVIPELNKENYQALKTAGIIHSGMIPKLDNAFDAIDKGLAAVIIAHARQLSEALKGKAGTRIQ